MDHPRPGLRYVDTGDLDKATIDFDGMNVDSNTGEKLGEVNGFVMDIHSARPYYVVVDAGSWFTSKYVLIPVGHIGLDAARRKMIADISRDRVKRYPGFDRDEFERLSPEELERMDEQMVSACCPDDLGDRSSTRLYERRHYQSPSWWDASYYRTGRHETAAGSSVRTGSSGIDSPYAPGAPGRPRETVREQFVARSDDDSSAGDVSPHFGGRAQPGDVLGIETAGEQTHVGETTGDEDQRRRDAEKAAGKQRSRE
jgi:hypothetical protein